jgi:hypothetical protein
MVGAAPAVKGPDFANPPHFLHLQFTVDGTLCDEPCRPDVLTKGARDICVVNSKGEKGDKKEDKECVKIASVNAMRIIVQESRDGSTKEFEAVMKIMEALMEQYPPIAAYFDEVKDKRKEYNIKISIIRGLMGKIRDMITTLEDNALQVEELRDKLRELKDMLIALKADWVLPEADCTGLTGYFKEVEGDGLHAKYYNNLVFKGEPVKQIDKQINFFWSEESPVKEVNPNNWTGEWEGFFRVPVSGEYTLTCESDDGCIVEIGGSKVIVDNMSDEPFSDLAKPMKDVMEQAAKDKEWNEFIKVKTSTDPPRFPR